MANKDCTACTDLQTYAPDFVLNGVTSDVDASLRNDTGFDAANDRNDCTDLNDAADCLVGNMDADIDAHDVCDWKTYMHELVSNMYNMFKAIISAICGIWTNIHNIWAKLSEHDRRLDDHEGRLDEHDRRLDENDSKIGCVKDAIRNLVTNLNSKVNSDAFVRYYRDNSGQGVSQYYWDATTDAAHVLNIYMDADVDNAGSKAADRDYLVIVNNCTDIQMYGASSVELNVTCYSSGDNRNINDIEKRQAQHPCITGSGMTNFSWTTSSAVLIKKGAHLRIRGHVYQSVGGSPKFRIHQVVTTWIPVNAGSQSLNIGDILKCD